MNSNSNMREQILVKIDTQNVRMRSRTFFLFKIAGIALLAAIILVVTIIIGNLVFFTLRLNGQGFLLHSGLQGFLFFVQVFPWWLVLIDVVLIFLLERLLHQFRFGYRSPFLYVILGLLFIAAIGGVLIDSETPLNDQLLNQADQGHLPQPFRVMYKHSRIQPPQGSGLFRGVVMEVSPTTTVLSDADNDDYAVIELPSQSDALRENFSIGESVVVIGTVVSSTSATTTIRAFEIHPLDPNYLPPEILYEAHEGGK